MSNFAMWTILKGFCTSLSSIITSHSKSEQKYKKLRQISVTWSSLITCRQFLCSSTSRDINEHTYSLVETRCPLISWIRVISMPRISGLPCVYFGNEVRSSSGSSIGVFSDRWQESFGNNAIIHCTHVPSPAILETWSGIDCDVCRYVDKIHTICAALHIVSKRHKTFKNFPSFPKCEQT